VIHLEKRVYIGELRRFMQAVGFEPETPASPGADEFDERKTA
jgi:hypothetical protein